MFDIFSVREEEGSQRVCRRGGVIYAPTGGGERGRATYFLRAYAGAPVAQTLRLSLLRCGERLCDTLRALPENVAAPNACWGKGTCYPRSVGEITPPPERFEFAAHHPSTEEIFEKYS